MQPNIHMTSAKFISRFSSSFRDTSSGIVKYVFGLYLDNMWDRNNLLNKIIFKLKVTCFRDYAIFY